MASVVTFHAEMATKRASGGRQDRPRGDKIDNTEEIRRLFIVEREANDWTQRDLATRMNVTPATISNVETGASKQITKELLARFYRAIAQSRKMPDGHTIDLAAYRSLTAAALNLSPENLVLAADLIKKLANQK